MDRVLELSFAFEPDMVKFVVPTVLLAGKCGLLAEEVQSLKGRFEVIQILRAFVVAHIFRFVQYLLRNDKLPSYSYLGKVFLFCHIPITVVVGAFYTISHLFPSSSLLVGLVQTLLLFITLFIPKPGMGLKQDSSNASIVLHQHNYDGANNNSMITNTIMGPMDLQVTDHFITTLLAGFCVDLVVQLERLKGNFEFPHVLVVLVIKHIPCFKQFVFGRNKVPPVYYLRNVILSYDILVTMTIAAYYIIFSTPSKTLLLVIFLELSLLPGIDIFMPKRGELNQAMRWKLEQDINPNQASSPNNESVDAGSASVHDASNRVENAADANSISDTNNSSRWIHKGRIGSGGFGAVFVVENKKTGDIAAVKVLKDNHRPENVESIQKEIKFLSQLKHPNIVEYLDHEIIGGDIYLYMEIIQPGSLDKYISKHGALHESLVRDFTAQILSGLFYLHKEQIVHRDIKPDNILVDSKNSNNTIKLVDFGLAKHLTKSVGGKHSVWGTQYYAAPELRKDINYKNSDGGSTADIWSLGCVIIEMLTGKIPRHDSNMRHPPIPEKLCPEGKAFLKRCFKEDPNEQASAEELQDHPFVRAQARVLMEENRRIECVESG